MKLKQSLFCTLVLICLPALAHAQAWSGIIDPSRATDWSLTGIPGGIPNRTTVCATINASSYGNGSSDATSAIQTALNGCASGQVVSLSAGTFRISNLSVPSNVTLRGQGADQTKLSAQGSGSAVIALGSSPWPSAGGSSITAGATAGSTSISLSSASGVTVGSYLMVTELNDSSFVTIGGTEGTCSWCDGGLWSGARARGQIVEVTSVAGNTIGFTPALYSSYSHTPLATSISMGAKYAGVENLQVYANNTGYTTNFLMQGTAYCWLKGVEGNYADGDHVEAFFSYRGEIRNSYFSNAFSHGPGQTDADVFIVDKTTGFRVENNILERLHVSIMTNWGAAGNVIAYNYSLNNFDSGGGAPLVGNFMSHGAHPQFNLWEGNIGGSFYPDSVWGSSSHNTFYRNWVLGTSEYCNPLTGRGTVTCSGSWSNQANRAMQIAQYSTYYNFVGNVVGSAQVASQMTEVNKIISPTNRPYDGTAYDYTFGYGELADGSGNCSSSATCAPYTTAFIHGDYTNADGAINWSGSVTHTLPASLYLSAKPSWWPSTLAWPAIGPDVTGGSGPGGHVSTIPAKACYQGVMGGTSGSGAPLAFNADACYNSSGSTPAPAPPTNVSATVQ